MSFLLKVHFATTIDLCNNLFNLFLDRKVIVIQTFIVSWVFSDSLNNRFSKRYSTFCTISPNTSQFNWHINRSTEFFQGCNFSFCIRYKFVNSHNCWNTELTDIFNVAFQVSKTCTNSFYVFFCQSIFSHATIHLKGTKGCNNNYCIWRCWQVWCLNIKEFLGTKVCTKTSFCDCIISQVKGCCSCQDRVTSVSNIGKWTTMYKGRRTINCLNQVWLNRILQNQS